MSKPAAEHKGRPFTVRLSPGIERWIVQEASHSKRARSTVLEGLLDEAIRVRRFPGIAFRGPAHDRRAWVVGTALDVWEVIEARQRMGDERLLAEGDLLEHQIRLALSYYRQYPAEIDQAIAENRRDEGEWHALYPAVIPPTP
jgi:uncharacterized protein (DUF433 family)